MFVDWRRGKGGEDSGGRTDRADGGEWRVGRKSCANLVRKTRRGRKRKLKSMKSVKVSVTDVREPGGDWSCLSNSLTSQTRHNTQNTAVSLTVCRPRSGWSVHPFSA